MNKIRFINNKIYRDKKRNIEIKISVKIFNRIKLKLACSLHVTIFEFIFALLIYIDFDWHA